MGKGEIAHNEQFLLFPQCFLPIWRTFYHFHQIWNCRLQTLSCWKSLKFVVWVKVEKLGSFLKGSSEEIQLVGRYKNQHKGKEKVYNWFFIPNKYTKYQIWFTNLIISLPHDNYQTCPKWKHLSKTSKMYLTILVNFPLTLYHTIPRFNVTGKKSLMKTLRKKEKMLATSIFSFSDNVFYSIKGPLRHLTHVEIVCKSFQFGPDLNFGVW